MKNLIDRERSRENRNRIAEKNKAGGPKDTKAAPAKGDGPGNPNRKGSPIRGRPQERGKGDKICYKFQKGQCDKGKKCPFKHVKEDKSRTQSPRRNKTRSPSRGNKDDKGKKMSKEEMAKTPCIYHAQGKCRRGDKCFYKHDDKAAAAMKDQKGKFTRSKEEDKGVQCRAMLDREVYLHCQKAAEGNLVLWSVLMSQVSAWSVLDFERPHMWPGWKEFAKHRPREFTKVDKAAEDVPVSSKVEQHEAQVRARQLQETVKLHDSDVAPSCGFCCWNEGTCDIICKECRFVSGPKTLRDVGRFPSIATAAPKAGVS